METMDDFLSAELPVSEAIVEQNLHKMRTDMTDLLNEESLGGNAGRAMVRGRQCPCAAANCIVEATTGKMLDFTNHHFAQGMAGEAHAVLRVAYDGNGSRIVDWKCDNIHREARRLMQECIDRWNAERTILWGRLGD